MAREIVKAVMLGGKEFAFNLYNAKTAAAYEQGMAVLQEDKAKYESLGEMITVRVGAVRKFLDMLFGDGVAEEVLGEADDLNAALDCVEAVVRAAACKQFIRKRLQATVLYGTGAEDWMKTARQYLV